MSALYRYVQKLLELSYANAGKVSLSTGGVIQSYCEQSTYLRHQRKRYIWKTS